MKIGRDIGLEENGKMISPPEIDETGEGNTSKEEISLHEIATAIMLLRKPNRLLIAGDRIVLYSPTTNAELEIKIIYSGKITK